MQSFIGNITVTCLRFCSPFVCKVLESPVKNVFFPQELIIRNNSDVYKKWKDPPIVPHLQIYFFNITNKEEFLEGDKPVFQEVGPYCYR